MLIGKILNPILSLSRSKRLVILLLLDFSIIIFSFYLSIWLSVSDNIINKLNNISILIIFTLSLISLGVYYKSGQYRSLTRYIGSKSFYKLLLVNFLVSFIFYVSNYLYIYKFDFRFYLIFWILISFLTVSVRVLIRDFILRFKFFITSKRKIVIYGAGRSGAKLLKNLNFDPEFEVKFIIDDDSSLWNKNIDGIEILPPVKLKEHRNSIDLILMSIPSLNRKNIFKRFMEISKYKIPIFQFPSISQISSGEAVPNHLKEITLDYLLGRNVVQSKKNFINDYFLKKTVLITGGGGSIGRELCRQVAKLKPRKLIIIDHSEENLYNIEKELRNDEFKNINIISILGNVTKEQFVNNIFKKNKIDVLFHAAAYKHVPIVEENIIEGVLNNILSTSILCEASKNFGVDKFILISSDKAVRPTNIMGASKRISEMIVQIYSQENNTLRNIDDANKISFSMVRFGNVLGSSGSVVPLFNSQIKSGGPVTLTDKDVVRYFMTIEESVLLVIQSASMANGGEVFLLDMGYPVKIFDLAKNMIHLSGLTIKNNKNPNGDIEIITTGLRKGEKMYEELLIDSKSVKTIHPLIFKAIEKKIDINKFKVLIQDLYKALQNADEINVRELIKKLVPESNIKNYL
tara:strand:+ start:26252 stop:28147 length:1896 start_codon:yes stop_codon:yes gene_type:complete